MTGTELATEVKDLAKEHWWNGAGAVVVLFLVSTFIWKRPDNDWLLYAALIVVGAHSYISAICYERARRDRQHRQEIAVAYRESLKAEQEPPTHDLTRRERPAADRDRGPAVVVRQNGRQLVGLHA